MIHPADILDNNDLDSRFLNALERMGSITFKKKIEYLEMVLDLIISNGYKCIKLIDLAKSCGFNAVKFQKRNPDVSTPEDQKNIIRITPWGKISYLDYKKKIEFGTREFNAINKYCKQKKLFGLRLHGI